MSFDNNAYEFLKGLKSQSLWNRAMSFDTNTEKKQAVEFCLNPFGTGQCLSTCLVNLIETLKIVSIPLEQGNVFRHVKKA